MPAIFREQDQAIVAQYQRLHSYRYSREVCERIVKHVSEKHNLSLSFLSLFNDGIVCRDSSRRFYYIIGDWSSDRYFARGVIRKRSNARASKYLFNGQAGTGSIQVAHDGESDPIMFPEITELKAAYEIAWENRILPTEQINGRSPNRQS